MYNGEIHLKEIVEKEFHLIQFWIIEMSVIAEHLRDLSDNISNLLRWIRILWCFFLFIINFLLFISMYNFLSSRVYLFIAIFAPAPHTNNPHSDGGANSIHAE